jgi:hypothetical protein
LHHVRTQLTRGRIDDLKFLFYADGETVSHVVALCLACRIVGREVRIIRPWSTKLYRNRGYINVDPKLP